MTCRRFVSRMLIWLCVLMMCIPAGYAQTEDVTESLGILIVYEENISENDLSGLQYIVKVLTYMQYSVTYVTLEESVPMLSDYNNLILYCLYKLPEDFLETLDAGSHELFILGGTAAGQYVEYKNYPIVSGEYDDLAVTIGYTFSDEDTAKSLLRAGQTQLLQGPFTYETGELRAPDVTGSLYTGYRDFIYTPFSDMTDPILEASLTNELAIWLWPYSGSPHAYAQYIVIDEVYPFTPPDLLLDTVTWLVDRNQPFIISVMPIYRNGDYPAVKRFCEVLRYAQAHGGAVILHAPITIHEEDNQEQIWDYLTISTEIYAKYGIYPLGIELPESYMFTENGREIYQRYSTVFWYADKKSDSASIDLEERRNIIVSDGHNMIGSAIFLSETRNSYIMVHATAVYLDLYDESNVNREKINGAIGSDVPMKNLLETDNTVYANNILITSRDAQVYYNGIKMPLAYTPFDYEADYDYGKGLLQQINLDLAGVSRQLLWLVTIASTLFVLFILVGRRTLRRRFIKPKRR